MPELPDVEGFRRVLAGDAQGKRIEGVAVPDPTLLRNATPGALGRAVHAQRFQEPDRHGKWLIAPVDEITLLMHFGMTGLLDWAPRSSERHVHDRIVFVYRSGELRYRDMRRFGGVWLARNERERERVTGPLGPDARDLSREEFHELLAGRRGEVKAALMDQRLLAGLGNLLSDEILWRARLSPRARASSLSRKRIDAVYDAMRETLRGSIRAGRVPHGRDWLTAARDRKDAPCPRCGGRLYKGKAAGRTACWCPRCQRARH
jgi:formamidopyrimidine-DNA glycosylase